MKTCVQIPTLLGVLGLAMHPHPNISQRVVVILRWRIENNTCLLKGLVGSVALDIYLLHLYSHLSAQWGLKVAYVLCSVLSSPQSLYSAGSKIDGQRTVK